jgi:hypothetical protein
MKLSEAIKEFLNTNGNYPKFITIKSSFLAKEIQEYEDKASKNIYYSVIPMYIDNRINEDFLLEKR